jgi:outer membrane immunogenic protein
MAAKSVRSRFSETDAFGSQTRDGSAGILLPGFELGFVNQTRGYVMKKLLTSASFIVLSSATVLAADLPVRYAKAPAPIMAPVFSWTGCYVGVHAGAGVMHDTFTDENGTGGLAGGQLGCNYQDGNWVFGVEGEGYWSGIKSTFASSNSEGIFSSTFNETTKNKNDFSIAARAGIAFDRTLVYGKAGWVWGSFDFSERATNVCCTLGAVETRTGSGDLNGLLLGVGIEHALTQNWTVKLEYNFLKYGSKELSFTECNTSFTPACSSFTDTFHADKHIFKIGANYLFNMGH